MTRVAVVVLGATMAIAFGTSAAVAQPDSPPNNGIGGKYGSQGVLVSGASRNPGTPGPGVRADPTSVSVTCGTDAQSQLYRLGDLAPTVSKQTCADQTLACQQQSAQQKKELDPVVNVEKQSDGTWQYSGNACVANGPARVTPELVRAQAVRLIPTAAVGIAPKGTTLVNIETVLWADAPRQRELAPVTLLGQRVTVRIVLDHVTWNFGDGTSDGDGPAGKAYDAVHDPCRAKTCDHYYGHVFRKAGTARVTATASWHASFSVGGAGPGDIPGTVAGPASQADVVVKQARAVLVPNPGDGPN